MTNSHTGAGIIKDDSEASEGPECKEVLKDSHNYVGTSMAHGSLLKEFPIARVGQTIKYIEYWINHRINIHVSVVL